MKKSIWVLLFASVLSVGYASAEHHERVESEKHEIEADANGDGKVSFDEFKAVREQHMERHFKRRDKNNDGYIDAEERNAARSKWEGHRKHKKDRCDRHKK